jgi:hypothetical protein
MSHGGDSIGNAGKNAIQEAFSKIKMDMVKLNQEIYDLKKEQKKLMEENLQLKNIVSNNNGNGHSINQDMISKIVKETLKNVNTNGKTIKKFNKKRKSLIFSRIASLASRKNLSLPEIKERIVDNDSLCSKATFYRYVNKMKKQGMIDEVKINEAEIVITI